jgi:hypothetical protein
MAITGACGALNPSSILGSRPTLTLSKQPCSALYFLIQNRHSDGNGTLYKKKDPASMSPGPVSSAALRATSSRSPR